jgi:hypothetical protein
VPAEAEGNREAEIVRLLGPVLAFLWQILGCKSAGG